MSKYIDKAWGYEELLEHNDHYVLKKLFVKQGHCCSLQYHEQKHETLYVLSGTMRLLAGPDEDHLDEMFLGPGDYCAIAPLIVHRMYGFTDCTYLEASTPQFDDVVRVADEYGRV